MKIYILQDGQKSGPFTTDELRDKIYSGQLPRSTQGSIDGETEWMPLEVFLSRSQPSPPAVAPPSQSPTKKALRDPKEITALILLYIASIPIWLFLIIMCIVGHGVLLIFIAIFWLCMAIGEMLFAAHLKTNAVRVSETQLPEVFQAAKSCCDRLGMEVPEVYVMQQNIWNAFATKIFGTRMVVLLSGAVDSILLKGDMQQLTWVVGHELGHHWAGHLNMSQKMARPGDWLIWVNFWHSRRRELTCDRVGLYCVGNLKSSQLALINATVGAQLAGKVNIKEALSQWQEHRGEFFVRYRTLYSAYPHLLARLDNLNNSAAELGIP